MQFLKQFSTLGVKATEPRQNTSMRETYVHFLECTYGVIHFKICRY